MAELKCTEGQDVIKEGTRGDYLYVAQSGSYKVLVQGAHVHTYTTDAGEGKHPVFGELALMYAKPRAASVVAISDGVLWKLGRGGFKLVQAHAKGADPISLLRKVDFFASLRFDQLASLRDTMVEMKYDEGQMIFEEGEDADGMYVIAKGQCAVIKRQLAVGAAVASTGGGQEDRSYVDKEVFVLNENTYFGERALLVNEPRYAPVARTPSALHALYSALRGPNM